MNPLFTKACGGSNAPSSKENPLQSSPSDSIPSDFSDFIEKTKASPSTKRFMIAQDQSIRALQKQISELHGVIAAMQNAQLNPLLLLLLNQQQQ